MRCRKWFASLPIAAGGTLYLAVSSFAVSNVQSHLYTVFIFLILILFLKLGMKPEHYMRAYAVHCREFASIIILLLLGWILFSGSQFFIDFQTARQSFGIRMEDAREAKFLLIEDPSPIGENSWVADAKLLELSSMNISAEARGHITVFGNSSLKESGAGQIFHTGGELFTNSEGNTFWNAQYLISKDWFFQLFAWRFQFLNFMSKGLERSSRDTFTFLSALLLGRRIDSGSRIIRSFRDAGCMHLLALSGFHVGLIALAVRWLMKGIVGIRPASIIALCVVVSYMLIVGYRPSLLRAVLMYALYTYDRHKGYRASPLRYLSTAFILQGIIFPRSVYSISFVLSYAALTGILLGGLALAGKIGSYLPKQTANVIGIGLGAQFATMPFVVKSFGVWRPIAILSATVLTPFVAVSMAMGTLLMILPSSHITQWIAQFLDMLIEFMTRISLIFSNAPVVEMKLVPAWLLMFFGTILPFIRRSHTHAIEPRLPSLNPQFPEQPEDCSKETMGAEFSDKSRC